MASIALSPSAPAAARSGSRGRFARVGLGTVVAAVLANVLVYALGAALVGYAPGFVVLANASGTIIFTVVPATGAVLLYAALRRFAWLGTRRSPMATSPDICATSTSRTSGRGWPGSGAEITRGRRS